MNFFDLNKSGPQATDSTEATASNANPSAPPLNYTEVYREGPEESTTIPITTEEPAPVDRLSDPDRTREHHESRGPSSPPTGLPGHANRSSSPKSSIPHPVSSPSRRNTRSPSPIAVVPLTCANDSSNPSAIHQNSASEHHASSSGASEQQHLKSPTTHSRPSSSTRRPPGSPLARNPPITPGHQTDAQEHHSRSILQSRIPSLMSQSMAGGGRAHSARSIGSRCSSKLIRAAAPIAKQGVISITPQELADIVNFDSRENPGQLTILRDTYGGVRGVASRLASSLEYGLKTTSRSIQSLSGDATSLLGLKTKKGSQSRMLTITSGGQGRRKSIGERVFKDAFAATTNVGVTPVISGETGGMSVADAPRRIERFGSNVVPPPPSKTILGLVWEAIRDDPILKILLVSAVVVLVAGTILHPADGWIEGLAITVAVIIVLTVTAGNDYSKDKKFKKMLLLQSDKKVKVLRGGRRDQVSSWDVLVGDVLELQVGDEIPADGLFIKGNRMTVDESPLTGETIPILKSESVPFLFSGSQVSEGSGLMLATAVGPRSMGGQVQQMLNEAQSTETVLQKKLKVVAVLIGKVGFAAGVVCFIGLAIRWGVMLAVNETPWEWSFLVDLLRFFVIGITVVVVAVPEGLPLAVTISLAYSMFKMIKDKCFVRTLDASETMGEATCICTDKTGTLTENRMTVVKAMVGLDTVNGEGSGEADAVEFGPETFAPDINSLFCEGIAINSTCFVKSRENGQPVFVGNATEGAALVFASKLGFDYDDIRKAVAKVEGGEYEFSSERKRMSTLVEPKAPSLQDPDAPHSDTPYRLYSKGASEIVLRLCTKIVDAESKRVRVVTPKDRERIMEILKSWASEGLRTLALAYRDVVVPTVEKDPEHDLTFVGMIGIKDPVRKNVPEAVRTCQRAGLFVRMVTGDNILTACKIARECRILTEGGLAMEGPEFRSLSTNEQKLVVPRLQVLARSSPADKLVLVALLKEMGQVVAVTGDGTNDAPALKEADVGFAMGISGTQIAMNASDIVLLDDNFVSFVQSIKWGRNVLSCVQKFLQFQLSVNFVAIIMTLVGSFSQGEPPLTPVQLLWVNLIMDTLGALGLASDVPDRDVLLQKPHARSEPILTRQMKGYVVMQTFCQTTALVILLFGSPSLIYGDPSLTTYFGPIPDLPTRVRTLIFTVFVLLQVVNEITARQLHFELNIFKGIGRNRLFPLILFLICAIQVLMVQFGSSFIQTVPLSGYEWGISVASAAAVGLATMVVRLAVFFRRPRAPAHGARGTAAATRKGMAKGGYGKAAGIIGSKGGGRYQAPTLRSAPMADNEV